MLVLSRRLGEEIVIDGNIRITVVAVKRNQVRLGITAPPLVTVDRQEVHEQRTQWDNPSPLPSPDPDRRAHEPALPRRGADDPVRVPEGP
jgi:carbon storage regulator